ncbi:MAG: hypothetical protein Q4E37_03685 [Tissierellia bacterium]|nr:hypothetical protein [Tissierellia bacterium]
MTYLLTIFALAGVGLNLLKWKKNLLGEKFSLGRIWPGILILAILTLMARRMGRPPSTYGLLGGLGLYLLTSPLALGLSKWGFNVPSPLFLGGLSLHYDQVDRLDLRQKGQDLVLEIQGRGRTFRQVYRLEDEEKLRHYLGDRLGQEEEA